MDSNNERQEEKEQEENKLMSQVGEDPRAGVQSKPKSDNNDKQIAGEGDPTRSDE
jgi:hypothetical protein